MFDLLRVLLFAGGDGLTKTVIYEKGWQARYDPEFHDRNVYTGILRLRRLFDKAFGSCDLIQSRGEGVFALETGAQPHVVVRRTLAQIHGVEGAAAQVVRQLESGPQTARDLARALGWSLDRARRELSLLVRRGQVDRIGAAGATRYRLCRAFLRESIG